MKLGVEDVGFFFCVSLYLIQGYLGPVPPNCPNIQVPNQIQLIHQMVLAKEQDVI